MFWKKILMTILKTLCQLIHSPRVLFMLDFTILKFIVEFIITVEKVVRSVFFAIFYLSFLAWEEATHKLCVYQSNMIESLFTFNYRILSSIVRTFKIFPSNINNIWKVLGENTYLISFSIKKYCNIKAWIILV